MNLHNNIMNLELPSRRELITLQGQGELAYKYGHRDARHAAAELAIKADSRIENLENALKRIAKWYGEFPATGKFWASGEPASYESENGSNGSRDYMRQVALDALGELK